MTDNEEVFIGLPEALDIAASYNIRIVKPTAIAWIRKNNLGFQPGGMKGAHWIVNKRRWVDFITGRWHSEAGVEPIE